MICNVIRMNVKRDMEKSMLNGQFYEFLFHNKCYKLIFTQATGGGTISWSFVH